MAEKTRLEYGDFRPIRKDESGYSATRRLLVSPSTGEVLNRRQFINKASRVAVTQKSTPGRYSKKPKAEPRKTRADKGISRKDYQELVRPLLRESKQKKQRKLTHDRAINRFEAARQKWIFRANKEREKRGYYPLPSDYEPDDPQFYEYYDTIKHPEEHDAQDIIDARDYFYDTEFDDEPDFDYPWGETP